MPDMATSVRGVLDAEFAADGSARISRREAPLELRGPFADGGTSRYYLRNVTCGVFGGDRYDVRLHARTGARIDVSGSSATKAHATRGEGARISVRLGTDAGAMLSYSDGPLILQQSADVSQRIEIVAAPGSTIIYAETIVLGRLACGELLEFRRYASDVRVLAPDGEVLFVERYDLSPGEHRDTIAAAAMPVLGKLIVAGDAFDIDSAWGALDTQSDGWIAGYDVLPNGAGAIVRAIGRQLEPVAEMLSTAAAAVDRELRSSSLAR